MQTNTKYQGKNGMIESIKRQNQLKKQKMERIGKSEKKRKWQNCKKNKKERRKNGGQETLLNKTKSVEYTKTSKNDT